MFDIYVAGLTDYECMKLLQALKKHMEKDKSLKITIMQNDVVVSGSIKIEKV